MINIPFSFNRRHCSHHPPHIKTKNLFFFCLRKCFFFFLFKGGWWGFFSVFILLLLVCCFSFFQFIFFSVGFEEAKKALRLCVSCLPSTVLYASRGMVYDDDNKNSYAKSRIFYLFQKVANTRGWMEEKENQSTKLCTKFFLHHSIFSFCHFPTRGFFILDFPSSISRKKSQKSLYIFFLLFLLLLFLFNTTS